PRPHIPPSPRPTTAPATPADPPTRPTGPLAPPTPASWPPYSTKDRTGSPPPRPIGASRNRASTTSPLRHHRNRHHAKSERKPSSTRPTRRVSHRDALRYSREGTGMPGRLRHST